MLKNTKKHVFLCTCFDNHGWRSRRDLNSRTSVTWSTSLAGTPLHQLGYYSVAVHYHSITDRKIKTNLICFCKQDDFFRWLATTWASFTKRHLIKWDTSRSGVCHFFNTIFARSIATPHHFCVAAFF